MLQIRKSSSSAPVRILRLDLVLCRLTCTGSAASDMHSGRRAVTVGLQFPLSGEGAMLTRRAVASACCGSARRGPPAAGHNYPLLTRAAL
jgi:hypothetical protein